MKYVYYAKRKKDVAKVVLNQELTIQALSDEGYYTIASDNIYHNCTIADIERAEKTKAKKPKTFRIGRKGQKKALIL
ncbi:hypothetical protein [Persephonella sp.]